MQRSLESSEVVMLLGITTVILALTGTVILNIQQHRQAELESRFMGCKYLGKLEGPKSVYAFQCGQNIQLKQL